MRLFVSALAVFISITSIAQSIQFTSLKDGQIQAVGQGFKKSNISSFQVNFYKNTDFITSVNTNSNGSFSYTAPTNTFKTNNVMVVKVLNFLGNGKHFEKRWEYRVTSITDEQIKKYANQQSRTVANRVANTYGMRENFKYNFVSGFWSGYREFMRYSRQGEPGYRHFRRGYDSGRTRGLSEGINAGERDAKTKADQLGFSDAESRFLSAVDKGEPNTTVVVPNTINYGGTNLRTNVPSVYDRLQDLEYDFNNRSREFYWEYDGYRLRELGANWNLRNVYDYNGVYRFVDTYFRGGYALSEWLNNRLGGRYDYNIYKKLDETQKDLFERTFRSVYDRVIDEKFLTIRNRRNTRAYSFGQDFGFLTGEKVVFDEGVKSGFENGARTSSIEAYYRVFPGFYTTAFNNRVDFLHNNPVLILNDFSFIGEVYPTNKLSLLVRSITNYGGVAFKGSVTVSSTGITQLENKELEVERISTNQGKEINLNEILKVNSDFPLEINNNVAIKVGNVRTTATLKITWAKILRNASLNRELSSSQKKTLRTYVFNSIKTEWDSQKGSTNLYSRGDNSLLERMTKFVDSNPESRGYFRELANDLESIPPKKVAYLRFALKKRKKFFLGLLKDIQ